MMLMGKRPLSVLASFVVILGLLYSCEKATEEVAISSVTGSATDITELSATLSAYANFTPGMGTVTMGIIYSTNENPTLSNGKKLTSKELDGNNRYTVLAKSLTCNTTYYYKSFVQVGGLYRYGEVNSFTTCKIYAEVTTSVATGITHHTATLNGVLSCDTKDKNIEKKVWFLYSNSTNSVEGLKANGFLASSALESNNQFKTELSSLYSGESYYYIACARIHNKTFYGDLQQFQTRWEPVLEVATDNRTSPAEGDLFSVTVTTNIELSINTPTWIYATRTATGFNFMVSANTTEHARSEEITIFNTQYNISFSFRVSQKSPKSIYILAIGNSFSLDAMEYLYQILQELGYSDIYLGNLYIGGCTLQTHASNISSNADAYVYVTNSTGKWRSKSGGNASAAMKERDWDFVSMQQASGSSGMPDTFEPYLSTIVAAVKQNCPYARRIWHMTWAYQSNSTHSEFSKYGKNQITMYNAILNCVKTKVESRGDFSFVIPCGTAVQNLRTSYLGDTITRDGFHMSYDVGRYLTGLMWARQITGKSIAGINYKPSAYTYTADQITVIKDAVEKAYNRPYEITESVIPPSASE